MKNVIKNYILRSTARVIGVKNSLIVFIKIFPGYSWPHFILGRAYVVCNRKRVVDGVAAVSDNLVNAENSYKTAISLNNRNWKYHSRLASLLKQKGKCWQEVDSLENAVALNKCSASLFYRLAKAQDQMNKFSDAAVSYKAAIELYVEHKDWMYFNYGNALKNSGDIDKAKVIFSQAIALDTNKNSQILGVGIFYQKLGLWMPAMNAYGEELKRQPDSAVLHYYLGVAYDRNYDWWHAIEHIKTAISLDASNAAWHYRLGFVYERIENWVEAERAYIYAIAKHEKYEPSWFYRLGSVLNKQGKYRDANEAFLKQRKFQSAHGAPVQIFQKNKGFNQVATYTEYFENLEIKKKTILYESFGGAGMSCNPYAIFLGVIGDVKFHNWTHIWVINNRATIPLKFKKLHNVILVSKNSDLYLRALASSEYLINNNTFPSYFIRRPEQKYLNTWHGTPLKKLGMDFKLASFKRSNAARNFLHASHMISPNKHTSNVLINRYGINNIFDGKIIEAGYPRIDLILNDDKSKKECIVDAIGIDPNKPVILYAPTYRGLWGNAGIESNQILSDLHKLRSDKYNLVFRGHHLVESEIHKLEVPVFLADQCIDSCELLSIVDVLITDYSSIFYDFLPTGKPIIHYVYDSRKYSEERGLYFDIDTLPGHVCYTLEKVKNALCDFINGENKNSEHYHAAKNIFCKNEDGQATKRVIDFFFFDKVEDKSHVVSILKKKSILFFSSLFIPNGITSSIINLTKHINTEEYSITIIIDETPSIPVEERIEQVNKLNGEINVLVRTGRILCTIEEQWVRDKFKLYNSMPNDEIYSIYKKTFEREFTRIFGYHEFDTIVDFQGYQPFWVSLFAFGNSSNKCIYLHNDMHKERQIRFPYLIGTFNLYRCFNKLISVSESVSESNLMLLSDQYKIPKNLFTYCNNTINVKEYEELGGEVLYSSEFRSFLKDDRVKFINVARLSPEKGQVNLIDAFVRLLKKNKNISLYILGSGPLHESLQHLIKSHNAHDSIFLLGHQSNPYPFIKNSNCMILSSEYEGQGIVLLEAMIFGVPCISTDIPGPRSVLSGGYGVLVGERVNDMIQGVEGFLSGGYHFKTFDHEKYNRDAMNMFYDNVL